MCIAFSLLVITPAHGCKGTSHYILRAHESTALFRYLVMITNIQHIMILIEQCVTAAYKKGRIQAKDEKNLVPSMLFPFPLDDIAGAYLYKKGYGAGVWFVLKDDTVWDWEGRQELSHDNLETVESLARFN